MPKKIIVIVLGFFISSSILAQPFTAAEKMRWQQEAKQVSITRDKWGVPHVFGKTDADAVFGLMYAQAEDDFGRVEMNYIRMLGRVAEVQGEGSLYEDLQMRMLIDSSAALKDYAASPAWLKKLLQSWADGLNFYLDRHPEIKPLLITRFKPWYPLMWTDGSISAINTAGVSAAEFRNFYNKKGTISLPPVKALKEPTGSNGIAIAPSASASGHAMLYINPHVDFYFRPEVHMASDEGLNVYGAVTWGQFFIYQGFNENCGWMHTSSYLDNADLYRENMTGNTYLYEGRPRPLVKKNYTIYYNTETGKRKKQFTGWFTHHGPVITTREGKWISLRANNRSLNGLVESWQLTKARGFQEYKKAMKLVSNATNNTVYADAAGNIAYWHGNFVPYRDTSYDWTQPVDGSTKKTEWLATHNIEDLVYVYNPPGGWLQNCNSTPFTAAGPYSPRRGDYLPYMAPDAENFRGLNAVRILSMKKKYSMQDLIDVGYDRHLVAFDSLLPALHNAYYSDENLRQEQAVNEAMGLLDSWDRNVDINSVALTVAIHLGEKLLPFIAAVPKTPVEGFVEQMHTYLQRTDAKILINALHETLLELNARYGTWKIPWGDINRFQRLDNNRVASFNDSLSSYAVPYVSSTWGMLPAFASRRYAGTAKRYGWGGNSFICVVDFGPRVKAKSLLAGGESGDPASPHFFDQAGLYATGKFRDVFFYKEDVKANANITYHPGDK